MKTKRSSGVLIFRTAMVLLFILQFGACTLKLISDYDRQTDEAVVSLHKQIESLLIKIDKAIGSSKAAYSNFEKYYDDIRTELASLQLRAKTRPLNELQVTQLINISNQLDILEKAHKSPEGIIKEEIPIIRGAFNQAIEAILKLEIAKKRGD
ncbi:MAG TPA: hypothetical protein PLZ15_07550 [Melioribacteraceae bacterium]|nr:hypothetical protein [Melioribacteraceae bacterium]